MMYKIQEMLDLWRFWDFVTYSDNKSAECDSMIKYCVSVAQFLIKGK